MLFSIEEAGNTNNVHCLLLFSLLREIPVNPGGGTRYIKEVGMLVENFETDP